jgi:hypothetical protein
MIKKFESWLPGDKTPTNDNSKVWIIGVPSGEAFQVTRDDLNSLHKEGILYYTTEYVEIGFYAFDDENVDLVKRYVKPKKTNYQVEQKNKKKIILRNEFPKELIEKIKDTIDSYQSFSELYIQDDIIEITFDNNFYLEVTKLDDGYYFIRRQGGVVTNKYSLKSIYNDIRDSNMVSKAIEDEMYDIYY